MRAQGVDQGTEFSGRQIRLNMPKMARFYPSFDFSLILAQLRLNPIKLALIVKFNPVTEKSASRRDFNESQTIVKILFSEIKALKPVLLTYYNFLRRAFDIQQ